MPNHHIAGMDQRIAKALDTAIGDRMVIIDRLELELGTIALDQLGEVLAERISTALIDAVRDELRARVDEAHDPADDPIGRVGWYLEHGLLPWWSEPVSAASMAVELETTVVHRPHVVRRWLARAELPAHALVRALRQLGRPAVRSLVSLYGAAAAAELEQLFAVCGHDRLEAEVTALWERLRRADAPTRPSSISLLERSDGHPTRLDTQPVGITRRATVPRDSASLEVDLDLPRFTAISRRPHDEREKPLDGAHRETPRSSDSSPDTPAHDIAATPPDTRPLASPTSLPRVGASQAGAMAEALPVDTTAHAATPDEAFAQREPADAPTPPHDTHRATELPPPTTAQAHVDGSPRQHERVARSTPAERRNVHDQRFTPAGLAEWLRAGGLDVEILHRSVRQAGLGRGVELTGALSPEIAALLDELLPRLTTADDALELLAALWQLARTHASTDIDELRRATLALLPPQLLATLDASSPSASDRTTTDTQPRSSTRSVEPFQVIDLLPCPQAGLVLLWPFLPNLFKSLDYRRAGAWVTPDQQSRALGMLHFLACGEPGLPDEWMLPLHKLLVGLELDELAPPTFEPTPAEAIEADELLRAVIEHWSALKSTSVQSLRGGFLCVEGLLSRRDDDWLLRIERRGWDVLIDRLPWSISTIRLPWMRSTVEVEW
jgi:hypothetical protein